MFSWKKKAQEVDKTLKPESEKFKAAGDDGGIQINPKTQTVGTNVQQHIEKIDIPISEAQKIPASEVKKYTKAQLEKTAAEGKVDAESTQYKAKGDAGKLQYPTKQEVFPANVKQPGLSGSEDAAGKTYKDPGKTEKLDIPTKPAKLPEGGMVVTTDAKAGEEFKPAGEKEKIMTHPKEFKGGEGQPKSDVSPTDYMHKYDTAGKINKQFSAINWFKRSATTPEAQEFISKKIKKNIEEGKPEDQAKAVAYSQAREEGYEVKKASISNDTADIIIKAAMECPSCFNKIVSYVNTMRRKATVTREELDSFWKSKGVTLDPAVLDQQLAAVVTSTGGSGSYSMPSMTGLKSGGSLKEQACNEMEAHESKHHSEQSESPQKEQAEHEDETGAALAEIEKQTM